MAAKQNSSRGRQAKQSTSRSTNSTDQKKSFDRQKKTYGKGKPNPYGKNIRKDTPKQRIEEPTEIRLNKYIANSGICSRREADVYIESGSATVMVK